MTDSRHPHPPRPGDDRLLELLADESLDELDSSDASELRSRLQLAGPVDHEAFDRIVGALSLTSAPVGDQPLPASVADRVRDAVRSLPPPPIAVVPHPRPTRSETGPDRTRRLRDWLAPVIAAAAVLLLAITVAFNRPPVAGQPSIAALREQLLRDAPDLQTIAWSAGPDPAGQDVSGDVVWSTSRQTGFMRFRGLPVNNPTQQQYQLWVFDSQQDEKYPIDGGVFDIPELVAAGDTDASSREVIVPITPKIKVTNPTLFAITIEKPGGVVVSSRERLPVLAKVP
jgi:hypothetical protein